MTEANLSLEEQFLSAALLVGDLNAHDNSGRSLILIASLLNEEFNASGIPGFSSILATAPDDGTSHKQLLLEYFLEREDIPRIDKIDALEMAGAVLLGNDGNHEKFPLGFQYWRRALALRLMDTEDCRPIFKTPTKSGQLIEWTTQEELDQIEQDPAQRVIQSLGVRLRISSSLCWEAVLECFFPSFVAFLQMSTPNPCPMSQILDLTSITLDTILSSQRPHEMKIIDSVFKIERLILLRFKPSPGATAFDLNTLNAENLEKLVELLLMPDLTNPVTNLESPVIGLSHMNVLHTLVRVLSYLPPEMVTKQIRMSLLELIRRDGRFLGVNLLHFTCFIGEHDLPTIIRFLVQLGANPNARINGDNSSGVLHVLASKPASETRDAAARLLIELGAHLDMADSEGRTAADYWLLRNNQERDRLPDWLKEGVPKLMCLSARAIRRHRVPHDETNTPVVLIPFVELH